jgi:hypothetical protein
MTRGEEEGGDERGDWEEECEEDDSHVLVPISV